jgi:uncharacterized 2Fe-2S/4Fe-4S cluster protein (DUF4445 family)
MKRKESPWVKTVTLTSPTLQDNTADADRLILALKAILQTDVIHIDLDLLKELPDLLRERQYKILCILFRDRNRWLLTGIARSKDPPTIAGLAVDLGTTRVVLRLIDLVQGQTITESAFDNPQDTIGPDILARIHYADQADGLERLNQLIIAGLNQEILRLCRCQETEPQNIYALSVAGNTTMTHLFMGLNPHWIIREPYIPVVNTPAILKAQSLGIRVNPYARALIFPNVGSYFGGDLIAGILYSKLYNDDETAILVDVGTNAEVVVGNKHWLIACAGAAGPALEGGVARMGMTAGPGVIDKIVIHPETREIDFHTIEDKPPKGICGSGVIDLAAQLYRSGMIDLRGKFVQAICGSRIKEMNGLMHLVVVAADQSATGSDLTISQADIDSLIRSKAAMYTILETITASVGTKPTDLNRFYVSGTFGSFIDPQSAITIGMLPDLPLSSYQPLGNSSLGGAALALTSADCLAKIDQIRNRITYLELNVNQDFMNRFSAAKFLPHTDPSLFPSVKKGI